MPKINALLKWIAICWRGTHVLPVAPVRQKREWALYLESKAAEVHEETNNRRGVVLALE